MKKLEKQTFSDFSGGTKREHWNQIDWYSGERKLIDIQVADITRL